MADTGPNRCETPTPPSCGSPSAVAQAPRTPQPKAPIPSLDPGVIPRMTSLSLDADGLPGVGADFDVATMDSLVALEMLSRGVQALTDITGNVAPTPPVSRPSSPSSLPLPRASRPPRSPSNPATPVPADDLRGPYFKTVPIGSPEAHFSESNPQTVEAAMIRAQHDAIARKFFSKRPPPIAIHDYLLRMHRYCPMSTAVYLAAGAYIHKLALEDKVVPVTLRTVHRLLLGSLRVAMKALEDLSYPHQRFAGVGGVSERELAKLEVSVCYLLNFDLRVSNGLLYDKTKALQDLARLSSGPRAVEKMDLRLPSIDRARRQSAAAT